MRQNNTARRIRLTIPGSVGVERRLRRRHSRRGSRKCRTQVNHDRRDLSQYAPHGVELVREKRGLGATSGALRYSLNFACSARTVSSSTSGAFLPPLSNIAAAPSSEAFCYWWIIVGCAPYSAASSDTVRSPFTASSAPRDLDPGSWILRFVYVLISSLSWRSAEARS